jgi:ATP-dependent protease ClpP protease subunit
MRVTLVIAVLISFGCGSPVATADTLELRDGLTLIGTVAKETDSELWFDTIISGVRATVPIEKSRIVRRTKDDLTADDIIPEVSSTTSNNDDPSQPVDNCQYGVIPIKGVVGEDALAAAVLESIRDMSRNGISTIVLDIDTPGGQVSEAESIRDAVLLFSHEIYFVAFVRNSISAGIWPTFACDLIIFAPNGTMGGAVAFGIDKTTGSAEVDAKQNSIHAAKMAAIAAHKGHEPAISHAMMVMEASLYLCSDENEHAFVSAERPDEGRVIRALDTPDRVLTLIAGDATAIGLAAGVATSPHQLQDVLLGCSVHYRASAAAEATAVRHSRERIRRIEEASKPKRRVPQPKRGTRPW